MPFTSETSETVYWKMDGIGGNWITIKQGHPSFQSMTKLDPALVDARHSLNRLEILRLKHHLKVEISSILI